MGGCCKDGRKVAAVIEYVLSQAGQRASLLAGGDGRALQRLELEVGAADLELFTVSAEGAPHLKLREGAATRRPSGFRQGVEDDLRPGGTADFAVLVAQSTCRRSSVYGGRDKDMPRPPHIDLVTLADVSLGFDAPFDGFAQALAWEKGRLAALRAQVGRLRPLLADAEREFAHVQAALSRMKGMDEDLARLRDRDVRCDRAARPDAASGFGETGGARPAADFLTLEGQGGDAAPLG
jgi:hypothetical protein